MGALTSTLLNLMNIDVLKKHLPQTQWLPITAKFVARGRQFEPKSELLNWLVDEGSLTKRLIAFSNNQFSVNLLKQNEDRIYKNEADALNVADSSIANVREVLLLCNKAESVFARTVIPLSTLTGKQKELTQLNNKPLGAYLFSQPDMVRDPIEITCVLMPDDSEVWGRRSVFYLENKPLLVAEFFLPNFVARI